VNEKPGWLIHRYGTVTSTMDVARVLAQLGARDRTVVLRVEQSAGRGRGGRSWHAPAGTGVFCTIILRPTIVSEHLSTLPLLSGVAVAEAIEDISGCDARLKWPNDVWLGADPNYAKVAGVLVTSGLQGNAVEFVLVGIGINVLVEPGDLPPGATSLHAATGTAATPDEVFNAVLDRFDRTYADFVTTHGRPSLAGWRARAALLGEVVTVEDGSRSLTGIFTGIDEDGGLLIEEPGQHRRKVVAGDLVRGPRPVGRGPHVVTAPAGDPDRRRSLPRGRMEYEIQGDPDSS
jgi:BirA family transcriptional regulator, biotin operon repressor / biotin---[acetyl-CoA-carboxylase] ligase